MDSPYSVRFEDTRAPGSPGKASTRLLRTRFDQDRLERQAAISANSPCDEDKHRALPSSPVGSLFVEVTSHDQRPGHHDRLGGRSPQSPGGMPARLRATTATHSPPAAAAAAALDTLVYTRASPFSPVSQPQQQTLDDNRPSTAPARSDGGGARGRGRGGVRGRGGGGERGTGGSPTYSLYGVPVANILQNTLVGAAASATRVGGNAFHYSRPRPHTAAPRRRNGSTNVLRIGTPDAVRDHVIRNNQARRKPRQTRLDKIETAYRDVGRGSPEKKKKKKKRTKKASGFFDLLTSRTAPDAPLEHRLHPQSSTSPRHCLTSPGRSSPPPSLPLTSPLSSSIASSSLLFTSHFAPSERGQYELAYDRLLASWDDNIRTRARPRMQWH